MLQEKNNQILASWTTTQFLHHEKSAAWFWTLGIISAGIIIMSLLIKNYFFVLIVVLLTFLIYIQAKKHPRKIKIILSEKSLFIDEKEYEYNEFKSFWVFDDPELNYINLIRKKQNNP